MSESQESAAPRLMVVHAVTFALGVLLLPVSIFGRLPHLLLLSGVCFVLTGALIAFGIRVTFEGPVGHILRTLLGPSRMLTMYFRAALWVLAGVLVLVWGVQRIRADHHDSTLPDPAISAIQPRAR